MATGVPTYPSPTPVGGAGPGQNLPQMRYETEDRARKGKKISFKKTLRPVKEAKEMLAEDLETLKTDPSKWGLTEAQRQQMIGEATQQAGQLQAERTRELTQAALAGQGFQQGEFAEAARAQGAESEQAAATAAVAANELSQQMIQQRSAETRAALDAARERARENARFWAKFGIDTMSAMNETASSMMESGGGMAGMAAMASTAELKEAIEYLSPDELQRLAAEALTYKLASWRYKGDRDTRVGIIIDDDPRASPVINDGKLVDLYTYASQALALGQVQQDRIDALEAQVRRLTQLLEVRDGDAANS